MNTLMKQNSSSVLSCTISLLSMLFLLSISSFTVAQDEAPKVRLESRILGDKEQPAVSYFIPWQDIGTPDKLQWNIDRKHDNTLDLVDRDVMHRSMKVYSQMNMESPSLSE